MGRSKFPGKPSKLVNKKRVSVLNGITNNPFCDNLNEDDGEYLSNDQISLSSSESETTTTIGGHDGDAQKPSPPDPPDKKTNITKEETDQTTTTATNKMSGTLTRGRKNTKPSSSTTTPETSDTTDKKPVKKKTVTFKNILETSDDVNIVRKVYNPDKVPAVPIIKINKNRDELSRSQRFARGDIVMPSRLTEVLKNYTVNHIDKLNLLTFKSATSSTNKEPIDDQARINVSSFSSFKSKSSDDAVTENAASNAGSSNEKKFILPKRSAHSCRVIKPNKRFLDDSTMETLGSKSSKKQTNSLLTKKQNHKKTHHYDHDEKIQKTDSFINNTLSSQIISSKLNEEADGDESETSQTISEENLTDIDEDDSESEQDTKLTNGNLLNPFSSSKMIMAPSITPSKIILRQPRLQFPSSLGTSSSSCLDGPFSLNLSVNNNSITSTISTSTATASLSSTTSNTTCGVCGTISLFKPLHQSRKFGINSCEACRKFISKTIKKLPSTVGGSSSSTNLSQSNVLQCQKNDGTCIISPVSKSNHTKLIRSTFKDRCHACWLKKCIKAFQVPSGLRSRIIETLPLNMRDIDRNSLSNTMLTSPFSIKMELNNDTTSSTNIFTNISNNGSRLLSWPHSSNALSSSLSTNLNKKAQNQDIGAVGSTATSGENEFKSKLTNPLVENNSTFGSSPLIVPTINDKPVIMTSSNHLKSGSETQNKSDNKNIKTTTKVSPSTNVSGANNITNSVISLSKQTTKVENEIETSRLRVRKKERSNVESATTPPVTAITTNVTVNASSAASTEPLKRQRIDLKGPRVKHVCRSASIVLGQPIATFPNQDNEDMENITTSDTIIQPPSVLESMDTPPRPDSPHIALQQELMVARQQQQLACCSAVNAATAAPLSPPATPIECQVEEEQNMQTEQIEDSVKTSADIVNDATVDPNIEDDQADTSDKTTSSEDFQDAIAALNSETTSSTLPDLQSTNPVKKCEESLKPMTRKITRPPLASTNLIGCVAYNKNLNSFIQQKIISKPQKPVSTMISIDFWENYDPAEVCQTGFGLIVSENVPLRALCFLCGSAGQDPLIFCVCCCEPYHQYCVEDEYNLKHCSLDDTNVSIADMTLPGNTSTNILNNRLNWLCPRCTVCYTCNMASGSKVKCQKCQKNYHSTCLGTSKRLLGADRPLICANCLKCKSCGTTNVSKFVGNLPMCSPCFKLRQKGSFCPLCQKCYEDNDFNIKMMECGDCCRWVHSKCEGLTDEQYNMLSVLPENIEFICKNCAKKTNASADLWRDAVAAEFKSGLLSVVRLLSKSRQACALLKLSPRKKPGSCICQPVQSNKSIQFNLAGEFEIKRAATSSLDDESQDPLFLSNDSQENTSMDELPTKCYCGAAGTTKTYQPSTSPSLLEIKQKVNANEYYSLADFNYDMNLLTTAAACDDLIIAYKEILSETFPWFQNETKACTDALEEDMYDSCNFAQSSSPNIECDQQVPMIDIPEDIDDYFYLPYDIEDSRICMFCKGVGEGVSLHESRLLYCGQNCWVHTNCAMWSAEVFEEIDGSLQNVHSAISRGRLIKCSLCGAKGATVGCNVRTCGEHYHYPCARTSGCAFMIDKTVFCPQHLSNANKKCSSIEKNFEVLRPVYVELDRKRKKSIDPSKVQFVIGSLQVKQLGKLVSTLSDNIDFIVPADFLCTRLYWSSKEPWKIVEYTVKTYVQNSNLNMTVDTGRNFTVDHTNNSNVVQVGLAQISKWHLSLINGDDFEYLLRQERSVKQLLEAVSNHSSDETNEDEPQNNADLLPPEIKDAIFEDLPHDILDGISMLDIFPKLMTYEDLVAMDNKNEVYLNSDLLRDDDDDNDDDDDLSDNNQKDSYNQSSENWNAPNHVEDALLSASRPINRELKRSKSEVFSRGVAASRSHQRSSSLTWSCKFDSNSAAAKRRKMSRIDLRLSDGVLFSLGRRKDDIMSSTNVSTTERRRSLQQIDDIKTKTFTWSAATKKYTNDETSTTSFTLDSVVTNDILDKLKISQLDGMDDVSSGSEGNSPIHDYGGINITYDPNSRESPVKCDRCHCTYRTYDSFNRHLATCEPMSTSESESEATPRSPDMQSPPQQNILMTSMSNQDYCNIPTIMTAQIHNQQNQPQQIYNFNGQQLNPIQIQNVQNHPMQLHNSQMTLQNHSGQIQMQNMIINPSNITGQQVGTQQQQIFAQPIGGINNLQQQIFPIQNITQSQYTTSSTASNGNSMIEGIGGKQQQRIAPAPTQSITLSNGINIQTSQPIMQQQQQPQIITFSQANNSPQIMTISPATQQNQMANYSTSTRMQQHQASPYKNQLILPQPIDKISPTSKRQGGQNKNIQQLTSGAVRTKGRPPNINLNKPIQVKRSTLKGEQKLQQQQQQTTQQVQMFNQTIPNICRTVQQQNDNNSLINNNNGGNVIIQQQNSQPIIVQQMGNGNQNIVQYVSSDNHQMQYIAMPTSTNEFKHPQQTQYLTQNQLVPGTFQLQTDNGGNLMLAPTNSTTTGIQMMPNGTLQLTQQQQPQVIGTLIQPQQSAIQCGMMSADQMVLGGTPTLEMVANPSNGCMVLTSQPVYYGLETIVQNTVMSSQQFVSTAMQGVLSQNSSFSATTTQVFQASKIEPIMEMPTGYVVLNNDGTIMAQSQPTQSQHPTNINLTNVVPQMQQQQQPHVLPQIQPQQQQQSSQQQQWRFVDDKTAIQFLPQSQQIQQQSQPIQQLRQMQSPKPIVKSAPLVVTKYPAKQFANNVNQAQPQNMVQAATEHQKTNQIILPKPIQTVTTIDGQHYMIQPSNQTSNISKQLLNNPSTTINSINQQPPLMAKPIIAAQQRKSNLIKPIATGAKITSATVRPKQMPKSSPTIKVQQPKIHNSAANNKILTSMTSTSSSSSTLINPQSMPALSAITPITSVTTSTSQQQPQHQQPQQQQQPIIVPLYQQQIINPTTSCASSSSPIVLQQQSNDSIYNNSSSALCVDKSLNQISAYEIVQQQQQATDIISSSIKLNAQAKNAFVSPPQSDSISLNPPSTISNLIQPNYLQHQQSLAQTLQYPTTTSSSIAPQAINLPNQASIQLPTAPYANNIPTNVVNPIQQQHYSTTNTMVSRPTNRVLPMQTIQQKVDSPPPTPPEPKPIEQINKKPQPITIETSKLSPVLEQEPSPNQLVIVEKLDQDVESDEDVDQNDQSENVQMDIIESNEIRTTDFSEQDLELNMEIDKIIATKNSENKANEENINNYPLPSMSCSTTDDIFDKLKCESSSYVCGGINNSGNLISSSSSSSSVQTTLEVKDKISEILDNLEKDECTSKSVGSPTITTTKRNISSLYDEDIDDCNACQPILQNIGSDKENQSEQEHIENQLKSIQKYQKSTLKDPHQSKTAAKSSGPKMLYEIQSQDGFTYKSTSITEIWQKVFETVQLARKAHGLAPLPEGPLADMCGHQMLGLKTNALKYLVEQLPGVEKCTKYTPRYHKKTQSSASAASSSGYCSDSEELIENVYGAARCEGYSKRSEYDMFSWLASRHRKQPIQMVIPQVTDIELIPRRGTGSNLPMAMRYRTLKDTYKETVGVYRSHIHGRGLFCNRDIEAGEMVIEYAGELIRSTLTDKRERYYDGRGIGCYMFKIDENLVVDATMRGNAARFINHACEPNCYSKVVDILGHKHIIIFALRRIVQGEELTYDYKFPFEETKIPCSCGSKKCRKYLN